MKKILLLVIGCFFIAVAFAQPTKSNPRNATIGQKSDIQNIDFTNIEQGHGESISNIPPCFCCDSAYQLQAPVISAPAAPTCSCSPITFTTKPCPGATLIWSAKDNLGNTISFSGGGASITLNYSLAQQVASGATSITVTLTVKCGKVSVNSTKVLPLKPIPSASASFSTNMNPGPPATYTATASAIGLATSLGNGWTLKEINCPSPNPCSWVPGSIKWQSIGNNITIPNGVLVKGKCYVLTHYVNVCSSSWIAGSCTVYKTICFTMDNNFRLANPPAEMEANDYKLVTKEMLSEIEQIK